MTTSISDLTLEIQVRFPTLAFMGLQISPAAWAVRLSWPPAEMDSPELSHSFEVQALGSNF